MPQPGGKLLLVGYGEIYETDAKLKSFRLVAQPRLHASPGRPDAVASYPAVRVTHGEVDHVVLATAREGYVSLVDGRLMSHSLPQQPGCGGDYVYVTNQDVFTFDRPACWWTARRGWSSVDVSYGNDDADTSAPAAGSDEGFVLTKLQERRSSPQPDCGAIQARLTPAQRDELRGRVGKCARGSDGRWWLAGQGLWLIERGRSPVAMHDSLPILTHTTIRDLAISSELLVLGLGKRGMAVLHLDDFAP